MAFFLLPIIALAFSMGLITLEYVRGEQHLPSAAVSRALHNGEQFIAYRNAVAIYLQNNPTFLGTVSANTLSQQGTIFSTEFISFAKNEIIEFGNSGRIIICHAALPPDAISGAFRKAENDMSLGIANRQQLMSPLFGAITPLGIYVPDGNIVSIVQIGN